MGRQLNRLRKVVAPQQIQEALPVQELDAVLGGAIHFVQGIQDKYDLRDEKDPSSTGLCQLMLEARIIRSRIENLFDRLPVVLNCLISRKKDAGRLSGSAGSALVTPRNQQQIRAIRKQRTVPHQ